LNRKVLVGFQGTGRTLYLFLAECAVNIESKFVFTTLQRNFSPDNRVRILPLLLVYK